MGWFGTSQEMLESGAESMARVRDGRILRGVRVVGKILYWLAVLILSFAILYGLVKFFEARDSSQLDSGVVLPITAR